MFVHVAERTQLMAIKSGWRFRILGGALGFRRDVCVLKSNGFGLLYLGMFGPTALWGRAGAEAMRLIDWFRPTCCVLAHHCRLINQSMAPNGICRDSKAIIPGGLLSRLSGSVDYFESFIHPSFVRT